MSISLAPIHIPAIRPGFESDATTPVKRHAHPWPYENEFNQYHHASPYYLDRDRKPMFYGYAETQFQVSCDTRQKLRLELRARRDWTRKQQFNNVNVTLNPLFSSSRLLLLLLLLLRAACILAQLSWSADLSCSGGLHERHRRPPCFGFCGGSGATVCGGHLAVQLRYAHLLLARWAARLPRGLLEHR